MREHLVLRGFPESIDNIQVELQLRENLSDAHMTLDKALERALNNEAVTRMGKKDNEPLKMAGLHFQRAT